VHKDKTPQYLTAVNLTGDSIKEGLKF